MWWLGLLKKYWWVAIAAISVAILWSWIEGIRAERDDALIGKHEAEVARDTLTLKYQTDSTVVVGILASYVGEVTSLRAQLKHAGKPQTVTKIVLVPDTTHAVHDGVPVEHLEATYVLHDSVMGPPVDADAVVAFTPGDSAGSNWTWRLRPHKIPLTIDVGCQGRFAPDVLVESPPWARVGSVVTRLDPKLCGQKAGTGGTSKLLVVGGITAAFIAGLLVPN
jgi:hypothetical protein